MTSPEKPVVISAPEPRNLDLIFSSPARKDLASRYNVTECEPHEIPDLPDRILAKAHYIIGQPPLSPTLLGRMISLKSILNVEGNLVNNMPYDTIFRRGIHVLTTGQVFALPVAEMGVAMALNLARGIVDADLDFRQGRELWGGESNKGAQLLSGSDVGIVGFGDLGRALRQVLVGFDVKIKVHDPWVPASILRENGVQPASLNEVMTSSDFVFIVAAVTSENQRFLGVDALKSMRRGSAFILLSRAEVVDFDALMQVVSSGHIRAASDVFPQEPLPKNHGARGLGGFLRSAHRAGALDSAFKKMGDMILEDMDLMDRGLPPMRCKRAERETVARMRSKPVAVN